MPVQILGTWGYENRVDGDTITYSLPTLHHRDYETILARVRILPTAKRGPAELARFSVEYKDVEGGRHAADPVSVTVECVDAEEPVTGFSDGMVMRSGTMLGFAETLKRIGDTYYAGRRELDQINTLRSSMLRKDADYQAVTSPEIRELEGTFKSRLRTALGWTVAMKKELVNVRLRTDEQGFDDPIKMMDDYIRVLGKELEMTDADAKRVAADEEMLPLKSADRPLAEQLHNLFQEIILEVGEKKGGAIVVSGFAANSAEQPRLVTLLNEMGVVELAKVDQLILIERARLDDLLREQQLAVSDLMDTNKAVSVGKFLSARYILTGSVIEMPSSVVIFGRVVNVETAEVESAAQVIVGKTSEVKAML
jgi:TolB-like protein